MKLLFLIPAVMNLASLIAAGCLFKWMSNIKGSHAKKLLTRQLWHLALADLCEFLPATLGGAHTILIQFFGLGAGRPSVALDVLCNGYFAANLGCMVSVVIEVQLAITCIAVICRWKTLLVALSHSVILAWPVGATLGSLVVGMDKVYWDADIAFCNTRHLSGESLKSLVLTIALSVCSLLYGIGISWRRWHAGAPSKGVWDRARCFVLAAIISWTPFVAYQFVARGTLITKSSAVAFTLVLTSLNANGLLNAWAYARQSRLVRRMIRDAELRTGKNKVSFCVDFKSEADVLCMSTSDEIQASAPDSEAATTESFQAAHWRENLENDLLFGPF